MIGSKHLREALDMLKRKGFTVVDVGSGARHYKVWIATPLGPRLLVVSHGSNGDWRVLKNMLRTARRLQAGLHPSNGTTP